MTRNSAIKLILDSNKSNYYALFAHIGNFELVDLLTLQNRSPVTMRFWCKRVLQRVNDQVLFALLPESVKFPGA